MEDPVSAFRQKRLPVKMHPKKESEQQFSVTVTFVTPDDVYTSGKGTGLSGQTYQVCEITLSYLSVYTLGKIPAHAPSS